MKLSRVLLTDGIQRKTLSVVRSLGKKGIKTVVGDKHSFSPASASRFCFDSFVYSDPEIHQARFLDQLLLQIEKRDCQVIFPMDDLTLGLLLQHRAIFEEKCRLPLPENRSFEKAADKYETCLLAERAGVDYPVTYMPTTRHELENLAEQMIYPVIIKPRKSSGSRGIRVANNETELIKLYWDIHRSYPFPMIQEYIPLGDRYDVCLLYDQKHEIKCSFVQKEIRHFPIEIGPSTVQESVEFPELVMTSKRLLEELNWVGVVEIEYMVDPRTGNLKLMEINPRFWNSLELSIQCGVDFPFYLLKVALNEPFEGIFRYSIGKQTRWLIPGDILHFMTNKNRFQMNPPLLSFRKNETMDDTFLLSDPLPTLATIIACLRYSVSPQAWKMMFKR
jgi:predicted ATP-grasp superfamily ATP-dependent carboligase